MTAADDIAYLEEYRARILKFLVDGAAPSMDPVWGGKGIFQMDEGMKDPAFRDQRQELNRMKGRATKIVEGLGVACTFNQHPPAAAGGPMQRRPLFDLITDNRTAHSLDGALFTDKLDEAIGLLQSNAAEQDITAALPVLPVRDLAAAGEFYETKLGFTGRSRGDTFAIIERGTARIMLRADDSVRREGTGWNAVLHTTESETLAAEFIERGVAIAATETGFTVTDPDGNTLFFGDPA